MLREKWWLFWAEQLGMAHECTYPKIFSATRVKHFASTFAHIFTFTLCNVIGVKLLIFYSLSGSFWSVLTAPDSHNWESYHSDASLCKCKSGILRYDTSGKKPSSPLPDALGQHHSKIRSHNLSLTESILMCLYSQSPGDDILWRLPAFQRVAHSKQLQTRPKLVCYRLYRGIVAFPDFHSTSLSDKVNTFSPHHA